MIEHHVATSLPAEPFPLWPGGTPESPGDAIENVPTLTLYRAEGEPSGAAMVVCPGGGYENLAPHEGEPVARWLASLGITAAVLHYRLGPQNRHPAMLHDAQRAIRTLRARAAEWGIDPTRIGILGFSAGGHLASTAATNGRPGDPRAEDPIEWVSARPDLAVLVYPVITMMDPFAHEGSRGNLLGESPDETTRRALSSELRVTDDTPPCFLLHTVEDDVVPVENTLMFAGALRREGVPFEMHIYERGPHGFGLGAEDPVLSSWPLRCADWLRGHGFTR